MNERLIKAYVEMKKSAEQQNPVQDTKTNPKVARKQAKRCAGKLNNSQTPSVSNLN